MITWTPETETETVVKITPLGWLRVVVRALVLCALVFGGLVLLLLVRLLEAPIFAPHRPITPWITRVVCRAAFVVLGMEFSATGTPMRGGGAVVANHSSWLDIFALNARQSVYFVSKSEVAKWPGIGWLARATGTLFIERRNSAARAQKELLHDRLSAGHQLLFFPEGTSTDGLRVLPFKSTLFAAFFAQNLHDIMRIQPVTVIYTAPAGQEARFYGWWGDMDFGSHLLKTLAAPRQGKVTVVYHPEMTVTDFSDRKTIAMACCQTINQCHRREIAVQCGD